MAQDSIPRDALVGNLQSRYTWRKVERPKPWRPKTYGEALLGFYGGKSVRNGRYGEYTVVLIHVPATGSFMLSGVQVTQAFDAAGLNIGWPVKVVWKGERDLGEIEETIDGKKHVRKKTMKEFEVFIAEGDPVAAEELPKVTETTTTEPQ